MTGFLLLLDSGPCMGSFETKRAPVNLRAVRAPGGRRDVLDLPEDTPESDEAVFLYRRHGGAGHCCMRGPTRCLTTLTYRYIGQFDADTWELTEASDDELAWWADQRPAALEAWAHGRDYIPAEQGALFA